MIGDRLKLKRDLRVDFLRGVALLTIFIDHVPQNRWAAITQQNFGFSDAAELFVALAGYSAVLAYARYFDSGEDVLGWRRITSRIGMIYLFHLGTLVVVVAGCYAVSKLIDIVEQVERLRIEPLLSGDPLAVAAALALIEQPTYFDILPLYIVLLALFPLLFLLLRWSIKGAIAASASVWLIAQFVPLNLPTSTGEGWHFNPFAWQLLLTLGMAAALSVRQRRVPKSPWLIGAAVMVLVVSFILRAPWANWPLHIGAPFVDLTPYGAWMVKTNLGPARLVHITAFGYLLLVVVPPRAAWLKRPAARLVSDVGTNSLEIFCLGVILSVMAALTISAFGRSPTIESWITTVGVAVLLLAGVVLADRVRARKRARGRTAKIKSGVTLARA